MSTGGVKKDLDWLERGIDKARKPPSTSRRNADAAADVDPAEIDAVVREMSGPGDQAKRIRADVAGALEGVRKMYRSGLTREAFILLVHDRCGFTKKHRVKPTPEAVGLVLDALGKLGEFLVEEES